MHMLIFRLIIHQEKYLCIDEYKTLFLLAKDEIHKLIIILDNWIIK